MAEEEAPTREEVVRVLERWIRQRKEAERIYFEMFQEWDFVHPEPRKPDQ